MAEEIKKYPAGKAIEEVGSGEAVIVNVCMPEEYGAEHIPGSINIPIDELLAGKDPEVPKDKKILTHCISGGRAQKAKETLEEHGFTNVHNMGGLTDWEEAGGAVERIK